MPDLIITPGSGLIEFVKEGAQSPTVYRLEMAEGAGLILNAPLTSSVGMKAPNMMDSFGNNIFSGTSTFNGPTVINGNLSVFGTTNLFSASNVYISSSQLTVEDNIITLNAFSPYLRYAGIEMIDSGSGTLSSMLWDGQGDYFFLSGSSVNGKILTGPDNQADLTSNYVPKATAGYKLGNSVMYDDGARVGIATTAPSGSLTIQSNGNQLRLQTSSGPNAYYATIDALYNSTHPFSIAVAGNSVNTAEYFGIYADAGGSNPRIALLNGNVGIGITNPTQKLEVAGYVMAGEGLYRTNIYGSNGGAWIGFGDTGSLNSLGRIGAYGALFNINSVNGDTSFQYNSAEKMRITTGGHLGLGITNPAAYVNANGNWFRPSLDGLYSSIYATTEAVVNLISSGSADGAAVGGVYFTRARAQGDAHFQIAAIRAIQSGTSNTIAGGALQFFTKVNGSGTAAIDPAMVIGSGGNVGIGSTNPNTKLHIYGSGGGFEFGVGSPNCFIETIDRASVGKDLNTAFYTRGTGSFTWHNGSYTERMRIDGTGNVGINISTPVYKTEIYSGAKTSAFTGLAISNFNNYDGTAASLVTSQLRFAILESPITTYDASQRTFAILESGNEVNNSSSDGFFAISTRSGGAVAQKFRITSTGNVGVGTTSPVTRLDVVGLNGSFPTSSGATQATGSILRLRNGNSNLVLDIGGHGGNGNWIQSTNRSDLSLNYSLLLNPNGGNVGIGTTSAISRLDVRGSHASGYGILNVISTDAALLSLDSTGARDQGLRLKYNGIDKWLVGMRDTNEAFSFSNSADTRLVTLLQGGNLGIGTTNPLKLLHVHGTFGEVLRLSMVNSYTASNGPQLSFYNSTTEELASIRGVFNENAQGNRANLIFGTRTSDALGVQTKMTILHNGNVGIGTTTPNSLLEVSSSTALNLLNVNGAGGNNLLYVSASGNVGVKTNVPLFGLSVSGTFNAGGPFVEYGPTNTQYYYDQNQGAYQHIPGAMIRVDSATTSSAWSPATLVLYNKNGNNNTSTKLVFANNETNATIANPVATAAITSEKISGTAGNWATGNLKFLVKSGSIYTDSMTIDGLGRVGIGTTTPSTKLHIYENANRVTYISQNDNHTARFEAYGTATAIDTTASNGIFFRINGGDIVKFAADGAVGIGTSTVGAPLHIYRASNPWIRLNGGGSFGYIRFDDGTSNGYLFKNTSSDTTNGALAGAMYTYTDSGKAFQHIHAGSPLFTILSGGNIGIGTTAPSASLHVNSTTAGATLIRADGTNGTLFSVVDDLSDSLMSVNNSAGLPVFEVFADDRIVAGQYGQNDFVIRNNKVGIGTNNPIGELHVTSSTSIPSAVFLGGNVGVGTSSPAARLVVIGETQISSNNAYTTHLNYNDSGVNFITTANGGYTDFRGSSNNITTMRVKGDGTVGIGITSPATALHVVGVISGSSFTGAGTGLTGTAASLTAGTANALNASNNYQVNSIGVNIAGSGTAGRIGTNENGVRSWTITPTGGKLVFDSGDGLGSANFTYPVSASVFSGAGTGLTGTAANLTVGTALNVGNGTLTISTGTGIGIGATTTFTANQSGNSTITLSNTGVTSAVAGTGISVSGATGAVTITNSSPNATHTGDVTGATTLTIANDAVTTAKILNANVTLDKIANISTGTILGNNGAGAAAPLALTAAQVASMLSGQTMNIAGNAATSTIVNGTNGQLLFKDIRAIAPNNIAAGYLQFGFTTWANTLSTTPYADYLHLRSYTDSSGGNDNLVMFRKDVIGMRIWQQSFGSASNYSTYKDVAFTDQIGNGTITIAAGTGISVASNTFTTNQSGNSTVTVTNSGVTSNVAGTGISVSGATGAVTITNSGVTSAVAGTGVGVSAATGAVTFSIGQAVGTGNTPTFAGATLNGQLQVNHTVPTSIVRIYSGGSTAWSLGVNDAQGSYFNISADFGSILINKTNGNIWISGSGINNTVLHSGTTSAPNLSIGGNAATATTATNANAISFTEVELNAPVTVSGTWNTGNGSEWGEPKFGTSFNQFRYADGNGPYVEYNIPANHHSCFISQLQWDTGGYADCHGVQADGDLVFLRRINTRQLVENSNHGNTIQHDGATVTFAGSGLQAFTKIRITNRLGRIHMTGIAFTRQIDDGYEGTGMVHPAQISHQGAGSGLDADLLDGYSSATANTANTIVLRDASGNFSAGTITATLSGTATTATTANALNTSNSYTGVNFTATGFFQTNLGQIKSDTSFALLTTSNGAQSVSVRGILLGTSYDTTPGANEIRTTNNTSLFLNARGTGDIQFQTADSLKMMLLNNGNVGVGVSNPSRKLDVEGIVRTRGASGTGGFEIGAATTGAARWRIEWDSASDSLDFNWVA